MRLGYSKRFLKEGVKPDLISATSGAILSAYYFLQKDTNTIEKHYDEYFKKPLKKGDILTVIAKVEGKKYISGFGYIFYDDELEQCSEIDVSFCE